MQMVEECLCAIYFFITFKEVSINRMIHFIGSGGSRRKSDTPILAVVGVVGVVSMEVGFMR